MTKILTLFIGFLVDACGTIAGRVMVSLGISLVTYTGFASALNYGQTFIASSWSGLPTITLQILGSLRVSQDLAIIIGAITARLALKGLSSDALSFWVMRGKLG